MIKQLRLHNSLTGQIEIFTPERAGEARVYHCGPTVYKRQHLGNMRRYLFADFLQRVLRAAGLKVVTVMNITDVGHLTADDIDAGEDKLELAARERQMSPAEIAKEQTALFFADLETLNIEPADIYPRATEHIEQMQAIITKLLERGHAYQTNTGVYFDVASWPDYGKLSGNRLSKIAAGKRVAIREEKRQPADFALWKIADPGHLQQWDSPWGRGYPGWHIECSAMSLKYLGAPIDIHTGGEDNRFPHHENEIAQSEAAGFKPFVKVWLHNAHLQLGGEKLAKREREQLTLDTLIDRGYSPLAFRLLIFGTHYRQKVEFSWTALAGAQQQLEVIKNLIRRLEEVREKQLTETPALDLLIIQKFGRALADDLGTPRALAELMSYVRETNTWLESGSAAPARASQIWATLMKLDEVLGVLTPLAQSLAAESIPPEILDLAKAREAERTAGNFAAADRLRAEIKTAGWQLEDTPDGPRLLPASKK